MDPSDFEPLRSALAPGGPPALTPAWWAWVTTRARLRRVNEPAARLATLMGARLSVVDQLINDWTSDRARDRFADPDALDARFLAAVDALTREWLAARGIASAWLWRGEAVPGPDAPCMLTVDLAERSFSTTLLAYAAYTPRRIARERGRPLAARLLLLHVPASRICGTSATGLGIPDLREVILRGGPIPAWCWPLTERDIDRARDPSWEARLLATVARGGPPLPPTPSAESLPSTASTAPSFVTPP